MTSSCEKKNKPRARELRSKSAHYSDVIMSMMASQITGVSIVYSAMTGEFSAQTASNVENVSIWWRHHEGQGLCYWGQEGQGNDTQSNNLIMILYGNAVDIHYKNIFEKLNIKKKSWHGDQWFAGDVLSIFIWRSCDFSCRESVLNLL